MASVYKRGKKYYASFKNARNLWQAKVTDAHDKASALAIANKWETAAAGHRAGKIDLDAEVVGRESQRTIQSHLEDFEIKMKGAKRSESHIGNTVRYIRAMTEHCGWVLVRDISADGVSAYAGKLRDDGKSSRTIQANITAVKSFTKWLTKGRKLHRDPISEIDKPSPAADRRHERRMLLPEEWPWLERGVAAVGESYGMTAADRRTLYDLAL